MTTFHMSLDIFDPQQLYDAAEKSLRAEADLPHQSVADFIGTREVPDLEACLVQLLDPGTLPGISINQSWVENLLRENEHDD